MFDYFAPIFIPYLLDSHLTDNGYLSLWALMFTTVVRAYIGPVAFIFWYDDDRNLFFALLTFSTQTRRKFTMIAH
jgi:hypothetical protein